MKILAKASIQYRSRVTYHLLSREKRDASREKRESLNRGVWNIYYSREASVHWQIDDTAGTEKCDRLKIFIDSRKTRVYFFESRFCCQIDETAGIEKCDRLN